MVRSARMDNFKCFLIICVVFGHLLEMQEGMASECLYLAIYSFHMPLFVWVSGYFAKPADRKSLKTLLLPYLVFQILYSLCAVYLWQTEDEIKLLEPYWLMWFLMALFIWKLLLPLLDAKGLRAQALVLAATLVLSLLTGWEKELRYVLSFQRMLALLPMFLLGYYSHGCREQVLDWWNSRSRRDRWLIQVGLLALVLFGMALLFLFRDNISRKWLYWKYPYGERGGTLLSRAGFTVLSAVWLGLALLWMPDRRLPLLTRIGQNTLPVYLLHGFVIETLNMLGIYETLGEPWLLTLGLTATMVLLFSCPAVGRLFQRCFGRACAASTV